VVLRQTSQESGQDSAPNFNAEAMVTSWPFGTAAHCMRKNTRMMSNSRKTKNWDKTLAFFPLLFLCRDNRMRGDLNVSRFTLLVFIFLYTVALWLRHCAISRMVAGSRPDEINSFFKFT
jgi:hypothetical protein